MTFVERRVSAVLLLPALAVMVVAVLPTVRKGREEAFQEERSAAGIRLSQKKIPKGNRNRVVCVDTESQPLFRRLKVREQGRS